MSNREYKYDDHYSNFRRAVRARDKKCCKWPGCGQRKKLQVHHILPWQTHPLLRYETSNGILLCKVHHKQVTGNELSFANFLASLIKNV
jgi:5-methylcytosine-specific restriction endonuclease McrA